MSVKTNHDDKGEPYLALNRDETRSDFEIVVVEF